MEVVNSKSLKKPIISLKVLKDQRLLVVDDESTVRYMDKLTLEMKSGFKAHIKHARYQTKVIDFSVDGDFFATLTADCQESRLYNAKTKKIVAKVQRHSGEVSCVGIEPTTKYMFSSGDDGKTYATDIKSAKLIFTLPSHVDTINDIAFSKNSNWVATASYDKKISLFNLITMSPKEKLKGHASAVMIVRFFGKNQLISIDKNSTAIIWNIYSGKIVERLAGIHDSVTHITISGDEKFLFLGTALGYVLLYDLKSFELLSPRYIKISSPITAMEFDGENNHLILGTQDGFLMYFNIYEGEEKLKLLLKNKAFEEIQKTALDNPILAYTKVYNIVTHLWETTLEKAKIALQNGKEKTALALFSHFKEIPSKNKIIQQVLRDYEEFDKFASYAKSGKLPLAYSIANRHKSYKESKPYQALEKNWKKAFLQAQKYAMQPKGADIAKEILIPYRGISEKTKLIQELLTQGDVYQRFRIAFGQKDFKMCFELIKLHPFLKEFSEYDSILSYGDTLYIKSHQLMKEGNTHSTIKILRTLIDFPEFSEEVKELTKEIDSRQKFFKAIDEKDIATAYNMMVIAEDLQETDDGMKLQELWHDDMMLANSYALDGDAKGAAKTLEKYKHISSKYMAIGSVLSLAYMAQLEEAIEHKLPQHTIENGIKNYILNFGVQDQIENILHYFKDIYPESKLTLEHLTHGSLSMWRPSMLVNSILE